MSRRLGILSGKVRLNQAVVPGFKEFDEVGSSCINRDKINED